MFLRLQQLCWLVSLAPIINLVSGADTGCVHGPTSRACWTDGFNVGVDWDTKFPDTGKTVQVNLDVSRVTLSPDGTPRQMDVFNGQFPGPTIVADWGDTIQITVTNNLPDNGTSIHWHGHRQLHSVQMDGTNGLTECPIPPGGNRTYTFKATQYGTSWYHSHYSVQTGDGLTGTILINGPATADYDIDLGVIPLTDWFHTPMFEILASHPTSPPTSQSILVNGRALVDLSQFKFTPGKKHRLRFVNTGVNNNFHIGIDNHKMTVIAADFVPIKPFETDSVVLAVGQRYDVIVEANQAPGVYALRVGTGGGRCDGPNEQAAANNTKGALIVYDGVDAAAAPIGTEMILPTGCDEDTSFSPYVDFQVPLPVSPPETFEVTFQQSAGVFWLVNGRTININWAVPSLEYALNGTYELPAHDNGVLIENEGWVYYVIVNETPLPHPIHLHGHDFWIIATGNGTFAPNYRLDGAVRRDTHSIPGQVARQPGTGGYAVIAFQTDNPGTWLMHCHIPFHISGGLGVQFMERPSEIVGSLGDTSVFTDGCKDWNDYETSMGINRVVQPDSGLKRRSFRA